MPQLCQCPPVRDLRLLALAAGPPVDEPLQQHLEHCSRCREIWQDFQSEVSPPDPRPATIPDEDNLKTWASGVRRAVHVAPVTVASMPLVKLPVDSTQEALALLGPAEGPDELGRLGSYRLLRVLGSGANGVVFLAEDVHLCRPVALKVLRPIADSDDTARQRFLREARAAAQLDHDHVVTIYQIGEDRGLPFMAMKLLQGETLDERLKREGQLPVHEVLRIARETALGLEAAHEKGLVHRDVKPANIFLEADTGRVKIVDFGLARGGIEDPHLTRTGTVLGTPAYMSPEQARGERADHRSDLFSLGAMIYRMSAGRTPFTADDTLGMLMALSAEQPPPLRAFNADIPDELVGLVARLLAKRPEGRPQSAAAVAAAIEVIEARVVASRSAEQEGRPAEQKPQRSAWATLVLMLVLTGVGWAAFCYGDVAVSRARGWLASWSRDVSRATAK